MVTKMENLSAKIAFLKNGAMKYINNINRKEKHL